MHQDDGMKRFLPGSIIRVRMKGFLTYQTDTTVRPGPRLNMVVGPNGTGKSSIVCAICIGLNGKPELLGRSSNLYDFITRGEEKGFIELELQAFHDATNPVVRREMERTTVDGRLKVVSKWSIDGKSATAKTVTELTQKYGIQLDNLCQFLPQDQVDSFSKMTPTEMLVETQKALGTEGARLHAQQMELIELQKEEKEQFTNVDAKKQRRKQLENDVVNLERLCGKQEEREQHMRRAKLLQGALLWRQFDEKRAQGKQMQTDRNVAERAFKEARDDAKRKQEPWDQAKAKLETVNQGAQECKKLAKKSLQQVTKARTAIRQTEEQLDAAFTHLDSLEKAQQSIERKIAQAENSRDDIRKQLESLAPVEQLKANYANAKEPMNALKHELNVKRKEKDEAFDARQNASDSVKRVQRLLGGLTTQDREKRERFMRVESRGNSGQSALRLRDALTHALSEGRLKMPCFGPLLFEVAVKDSSAQYASFVETHLPRNMRCAFVAQCPEDRETIHDLRRRIGANVTVLTCFEGGEVRKREDKARDEARSGRARQHNIVYRNYTDAQMAEMQEYGVVDTLDKLLDVDHVVWLTLCQHCGFHTALAGSAKTEKALNQRGSTFSKLLMSCGNSVLYTPEVKYSSNRSLYSTNVATQTSAVQPAQMLVRRHDASDSSQRGDLERDLKAKLVVQERANRAYMAAAEAAKDVEGQIAKIDGDIAGHRKQIQKHNTMKTRLAHVQEKIEKLENDRDRDFSKDREKGEKKIAMVKRKLINKIGEMQNALDVAGQAYIEQGETVLKLEEHVARERRAQTAYSSAEQRSRQLEDEYNDLKKRVKDVVVQVKEMQAKALRDAPKKDPKTKRLTDLGRALQGDDPYQAGTSQEPGVTLNQRTADDIEEEMLAEQRQAESIASNPEVVERYREKKAQCEALKVELEAIERRHAERVERLDQLKRTWQHGIEPVVHKIDASFSNFFQKFGCRGEVRLDTNEGRDVKDWTIDIMVEFRSGTGLRVLDPMVNSGGERTVSTILYLMALQSLTDVPFRVVDEINQGMDANNERLVFERIADECCRPGRAQYFLITPKLLTGLRYPPCGGVNVMFILNGAHNMNQRSLDRAVGKLLALTRPQSGTLGKRKERPMTVVGGE